MSRPQLLNILLCQFFKLDKEYMEWKLIDTCYANLNMLTYELILYQKETHQPVHRHNIALETDYELSDDEAISFSDGVGEYAFSFQNKAGAETIWTQLNDVLNLLKRKQITVPEQSDYLSQITEKNLPKVLQQLQQLNANGEGKCPPHQLKQTKYLQQLMDLYELAEKKQCENPLQTFKYLCLIVKQLVIAADQDLLSILLSDQFYLFVFGVLENKDDDKAQGADTIPHRQYLTQHAQFIQVVEVKDKSKLQLIHFTYRLGYLKDCALAYFLDEMQMIYLKIVTKNCYAELIRYLETSRDYLVNIVNEVRHGNVYGLKFIYDLCQILKEYDFGKCSIYEKLNEFLLFEPLEEFLRTNGVSQTANQKNAPKKKIKFRQELVDRVPYMSLEILLMSVKHSPNQLRAYITSETQKVLKYIFFNHIIDNVISCKDDTMHLLYCELLRTLVDSSEVEVNDVQELFFGIFPKFSIDNQTDNQSINYKTCLIEICTDLAKRPKMIELFIETNFIEKLAVQTRSGNTLINLKILQFVRTCLYSKEEELQNCLVQFIPGLIDLFIQYKRKQENLVFAVMLQIVQIIYENCTSKFQSELEHNLQQHFKHPNFCRTLQIFKEMKDKGKKNQSGMNQNNIIRLQEKLRGSQVQRKSEFDEMNFNLFSSAEIGQQSNNQKQLVDYEDEDVVQKKVKLND